MIRTIKKIGNSRGLIFDQALRDLTRFKVGDLVNVVVHEGGTIALTPMQCTAEAPDDSRLRKDAEKARLNIVRPRQP